MASNEEMELKAGWWLIVGMLVVRSVVSGVPVTTVPVDGVQEVTFSSSQ
jgi:hypothetical protein